MCGAKLNLVDVINFSNTKTLGAADAFVFVFEKFII